MRHPTLTDATDHALTSVAECLDFCYNANPSSYSGFKIPLVADIEYVEGSVRVEYQGHVEDTRPFLSPPCFLLENPRPGHERAGYAIARHLLVRISLVYSTDDILHTANQQWCTPVTEVSEADVITQGDLALTIGHASKIFSYWQSRGDRPPEIGI